MVYVVIDEPNVDDQPHSSFAQELAKGIFTEILPYLNVFRTEDLSEEDIEQLEALHILPVSGNSVPADENNGVQYQTDEATGYVIDPNTGELLDPETYSPVEGSYSNLDGIVGVEHVETEDDFSAGAGF